MSRVAPVAAVRYYFRTLLRGDLFGLGAGLGASHGDTSRLGASHCCECILCAVPALSCRRLRCFSTACILHVLSLEDTTLLRRQERGSSDPQASRVSRTYVFDNVSIPAPLPPLLGRPAQVPRSSYLAYKTTPRPRLVNCQS